MGSVSNLQLPLRLQTQPDLGGRTNVLPLRFTQFLGSKQRTQGNYKQGSVNHKAPFMTALRCMGLHVYSTDAWGAPTTSQTLRRHLGRTRQTSLCSHGVYGKETENKQNKLITFGGDKHLERNEMTRENTVKIKQWGRPLWEGHI